eukprot:354960-Chlamydomonas_euryale.AAC.2
MCRGGFDAPEKRETRRRSGGRRGEASALPHSACGQFGACPAASRPDHRFLFSPRFGVPRRQRRHRRAQGWRRCHGGIPHL